MTDEIETTDADLAAIDDIIEGVQAVVIGKSRSYMLTAFAYILVENLRDDDDAKITLGNFVEQCCEGYKQLKAERGYN